jgi:uncharacterized membrane protein YecN with MAPEG domain
MVLYANEMTHTITIPASEYIAFVSQPDITIYSVDVVKYRSQYRILYDDGIQPDNTIEIDGEKITLI